MGCWSIKNKNVIITLAQKKISLGPNKNKDSYNESLTRLSNEYIAKTEEDNDENFKDFIKLKVNADTTENVFPIWIDKNSKVKIYVKGKWSILSGEKMVDYNGHTKFNHKHRKIAIGALVGRVHGGDYFEISNEMTLESNVSGPIYLFANNSRFAIEPKGYLYVYLDNVQRLPLDIIEEKLGWNINELGMFLDQDCLSEEEKRHIIFINKIRTNPKKFAEQYLSHLKNDNMVYQETYDILFNYTPVKELNHSKALFLAATDHAVDLGENGTTGHSSTNGADLRDRVTKYSIKPEYFGENCSYGTNHYVENIIQLLVNDDNPMKSQRINILNEVYDQIGVSIKPHTSYKYVTIQVFGTGIIERDEMQL